MKEYFNEYLVKIDFNKKDFSYCNIIVKKINKDSLQVISVTGKLGNQGRSTILYEVTTNNFVEELKKATNLAKFKMNEKLNDGFILKSELELKIQEVITSPVKEKRCSLCRNIIQPELYDKINEWARGEGKWDQNKDFVGYNKVICIPCQIEHNIFKKSKK